MSFDWTEYYTLAQELIGTSTAPANTEAKMRAAISRLYYAAFCRARNYLRDHEGLAIPAGSRAHRFVRDTFRNSQDRIRQKVGDRLDKLRVHRNRADYDDAFNSLELFVRANLTWAQIVILTIDRL
ncbi:MAG: hypothetical protein ACREOI_07195 [bacterium]